MAAEDDGLGVAIGACPLGCRRWPSARPSAASGRMGELAPVAVTTPSVGAVMESDMVDMKKAMV